MTERLKKIFTAHLESTGETYFEHMLWALIYSASLIVAGAACAIHSIFPFLFTRTASSVTEWLIETSERRRSDYDR